MTTYALTGAVLLAALAMPLAAEAQKTRAVSFDASFGFESVQTSGEYRNPDQGAAVDAMLAVRLGAAGPGAIVIGVSAGTPWAWSSTDICVPASIGGCVPTYPQLLKVGALIGWENTSMNLRAMAGPAFVSANGSRSLGFQSRLEGAAPISRRLALIASLRGTIVPNYRGDGLGAYALGVGVRIR